MASGDLGVPQVVIVGALEGNSHTTHTQTLLRPSPDSSHLSPDGHAISPVDTHFVTQPTPILRTAQISSDTINSPSPASHTSDTSSLRPPPSLAPSAPSSGPIQYPISTVFRDNNSDEHDRLSSLELLASSSLHDHPNGNNITTLSCVASSSTESEGEADQSLRLSPVRSAQSDVASPPPSPTHTHVDTSSGVISHPSSTASFFRATLHRTRQPSPSPSDKTYTGSDATQNNGQKGDNADLKRKGAQFLLPAVLDLNQEPDVDVSPFAYNPRQLAVLFNLRNLETLEVMGGVDAILRALGAHPTHGLRTMLGPPSYHGPPDPASRIFRESYTAEMLNTVTPPAAVPQGLQSLASLAGSSGASLPTAFQGFQDVYRASIEDRKRIFGRNIIPQCRNKTLLQLMWLALKDKVLVC